MAMFCLLSVGPVVDCREPARRRCSRVATGAAMAARDSAGTRRGGPARKVAGRRGLRRAGRRQGRLRGVRRRAGRRWSSRRSTRSCTPGCGRRRSPTWPASPGWSPRPAAATAAPTGRPTRRRTRDAEAVADTVAVMDAVGVDAAVLVGLCASAWLVAARSRPSTRTACRPSCRSPACASADPAAAAAASALGRRLDTDEGWAKYNRHYWLRDWRASRSSSSAAAPRAALHRAARGLRRAGCWRAART